MLVQIWYDAESSSILPEQKHSIKNVMFLFMPSVLIFLCIETTVYKNSIHRRADHASTC